jgi:rhamnose utilization protein RhaD (predicted bifunctional aldolase and dehydrogenase)
MKSLWRDEDVVQYQNDLLALRVYTSRLLGQESDLVLHGGGNTSVKLNSTNIFGETENILYVKGSGWDLATIEAAGFAPVKLDVLKKMVQLAQLSDFEMVRLQRAAMTDPQAPNPSVEAILHAIIPYAFVDHTHADAVITITNTLDGEARIREIYGSRVLVVPYVMPVLFWRKKLRK